MQIVVNKEELSKSIEDLLAKTERQYQKNLQAYSSKMQEFAKYIAKYVATGDFKGVPKSPPYLAAWNRNTCLEVLNALKVHKLDTVTMSESEYSQLIERAEREYQGTITSLNAIEELNYIG